MANHYNLDGARKVTELVSTLVKGLEKIGSDEEELFSAVEDSRRRKALLEVITDPAYYSDDDLVVSCGDMSGKKMPDYFSAIISRIKEGNPQVKMNLSLLPGSLQVLQGVYSDVQSIAFPDKLSYKGFSLPRNFSDAELREECILGRFGRLFSREEVMIYLYRAVVDRPEMIAYHSVRYVFFVREGVFILQSGSEPTFEFMTSSPPSMPNYFSSKDVFMVATDG